MTPEIRKRHAQRVALIKERQFKKKVASNTLGGYGHLKHVHTCACGRVIRGNVYFKHLRACQRKKT